MKLASTTVMIVDDDPDLMRIEARTLEEAGYLVVRAFGAGDALRRIRKKKPDLLLTDLAMPKMDGARLIRAIKDDPELRDIPCVAVSAHNQWSGYGQLARNAGCDGHIAKPFKRDQLLKEVLRQLGDPDWALPSE